MQLRVWVSQNDAAIRRIVIGIAVVVLLICAGRALLKPTDGDFALHRSMGTRFIAGDPLYAGGSDFPYPPFLGIAYAPAALLPLPVAKAVYYFVGCAALVALFAIMCVLGGAALSLTSTEKFWTSVLAALFSLQFIIRDQAEAGFNTAITALVWLGIYCWSKQRDFVGGACVGLATAIKCTPAIFIAYFVWKRQWRFVASALVATALFAALPAARLGPSRWSDEMQTWTSNSLSALSGAGRASDEIKTWQSRNMSLRAVATNYLSHAFTETTGSPRDGSRFGHWLGALIGLLFVGLWAVWSVSALSGRDDPRVVWEAAAAGVLMLLLSPIAWTQHAVSLIPACYLVSGLIVQRRRLPAWVWAVLSTFLLVCALAGRDLIPRGLDRTFTTFGIPTLCVVGLFAVILTGPRLHRVPRLRNATDS